jgi:hypothetical protein
VKFDCGAQIITDSTLDDINSPLSSVGRVILKAIYGMDIVSPQDPVSRLNVLAVMNWLTVLQKAYPDCRGNPRASKPRCCAWKLFGRPLSMELV